MMNKSEKFIEDNINSNPRLIKELKTAIQKFENAERYIGISDDETLFKKLEDLEVSYKHDMEAIHIKSDEELVCVLEEYGFEKSIKKYTSLYFWYS